MLRHTLSGSTKIKITSILILTPQAPLVLILPLLIYHIIDYKTTRYPLELLKLVIKQKKHWGF